MSKLFTNVLHFLQPSFPCIPNYMDMAVRIVLDKTFCFYIKIDIIIFLKCLYKDILSIVLLNSRNKFISNVLINK